MSHAYHPGLTGYDERNVLHDGCLECEHRAENPMAFIMNFDGSNLVRLWELMIATQWSGGSGVDYEPSRCDLALASALYPVGVLMERAGIPPGTILAGLRDRP